MLNAAAPTTGEIPRAHRHLIAQSEGIGGMRSRGKDVAVAFPAQQVLPSVVAGTNAAHDGVVTRQMIEPAPGATKDADLRIAGKGFVHGRPGAEIKEVRRRPDMALGPGPDAVEDGGVDGVGVFLHAFVRKMHSFSDESKAEADFFSGTRFTPRRGGCSEVKLIRDGLGVILGQWGELSRHTLGLKPRLRSLK